MRYELKNFEDKINDITNQFMSLLDSNYVIGDSITTSFDSTSSNELNSLDNNYTGVTPTNIPDTGVKVGGMAFADTTPVENAAISFENTAKMAEPVSFDNGVKPVGGISFANVGTPIESVPVDLSLGFETAQAGAEAPKFDFSTFDQQELDRRLEALYQTSKVKNDDVYTERPFVFSDSNIGGYEGNHQIKHDELPDVKGIGYEAKDKEGYNMANYNGEDSLFSFATVPEERALTTKRNFADMLFMDIPRYRCR
jgi:hypothetical protein